MFGHIFKNRIQIILHDRVLLFWTLIFPIALGTFFNLAFSNLSSSTSFEVIPVAVVEGEKLDSAVGLKDLFEMVSKKGNNQLLEITYTTKEKAEDLLKNDEIDGYIEVKDDPELYINNNSMSITMVKSILDEYRQQSSTIENILKKNPNALEEGLMEKIMKNTSYFEAQDRSDIDASVIYFYTLIGMMCMYGGFWGLHTVEDSEANLSKRGARVSISPISKQKMLLASFLAAFCIQIIEVFVALFYIIIVLGVDFGNHLGPLLLLATVGSFTGIAIGTFIGVATKCKVDTKITIISMGSLFLSFLSGMMVIDMKYIISENVPILAKINPVSLITDAIYSLYYYSVSSRYVTNVLILLVIGVILGLGSYWFMRRKTYDNI